MRKLTTILLFSISAMAYGQSTNMLTLLHGKQRKADFFYDQAAWRNSLELYLHITDKDPSNVHARLRTAQCYTRLNDLVSAAMIYEQLMKEPGLPVSAKYEFAEVLLSNVSYSSARHWYQEYEFAVPENTLTKGKIDFIDHVGHYLRDSTLTRIIPLEINSRHSDFGPQYFAKGLVFVSSRDNDLFVKRRSMASQSEDEAFLNLFYTKASTPLDFGKIELFGKGTLKTIFNDGPIAFFDHDRKAAFSQNNVVGRKPVYDSNGKANLQLFFADIDVSGNFKNIVPFKYNNDSYSIAYATFSPDGKEMFFSSNKPDGFGGADIYSCKNVDGAWTEPVNAGPAINTAGDELYPFVTRDSSLFFSSNGHGGLGGLDIFLANKRKGKFNKSINLGFPLNSSKDDFSIVTDSTGKKGYLASNRPGGEGLDDIYAFSSDHYITLGQIRESPDLSKVIPNVSIYVKDEDGVIADSTRSDDQGYFRLDLPLDQNYSISVKKEGYDLLDDVGYTTKGRTFGVDSLIFPLWKQDLFVKGKIYSKETQALLPQAVVVFNNLTDHKVDSVVVNETGEYSYLVYPNRKYEIEIHKPGFIPNGYALNTHGLYKGELLNDVVVEEVYIERAEINFNFNQFGIKPESNKQLTQLIRTLNKFPQTTLSIRAHADSRGSAQYNQLVSDKRAATIMQYFLNLGIPRKRIDAKGFGETLVLNRCSDGVECSEDEHSENRRAELKVQRQ